MESREPETVEDLEALLTVHANQPDLGECAWMTHGGLNEYVLCKRVGEPFLSEFGDGVLCNYEVMRGGIVHSTFIKGQVRRFGNLQRWTFKEVEDDQI